MGGEWEEGVERMTGFLTWASVEEAGLVQAIGGRIFVTFSSHSADLMFVGDEPCGCFGRRRKINSNASVAVRATLHLTLSIRQDGGGVEQVRTGSVILVWQKKTG